MRSNRGERCWNPNTHARDGTLGRGWRSLDTGYYDEATCSTPSGNVVLFVARHKTKAYAGNRWQQWDRRG